MSVRIIAGRLYGLAYTWDLYGLAYRWFGGSILRRKVVGFAGWFRGPEFRNSRAS